MGLAFPRSQGRGVYFSAIRKPDRQQEADVTTHDAVAVRGDIHGAAAQSWWVYALLGVLFLLMAAFVFGHLIAASIVSAIFFGAALTVGGAFQIVHAFWERGWGGFALSLIVGILYLIGGLWLMANPLATSAALTLFIAAVLVVSGVLRLVLAYRLWPVGGWMLILSGVIAVLAGLVIIAGWPASGLVVLGICLGLDLLMFGLFWLVLAFALRELRA
jgi:uncharacterized membrane protein HdeD (DUF308 family)